MGLGVPCDPIISSYKINIIIYDYISITSLTVSGRKSAIETQKSKIFFRSESVPYLRPKFGQCSN